MWGEEKALRLSRVKSPSERPFSVGGRPPGGCVGARGGVGWDVGDGSLQQPVSEHPLANKSVRPTRVCALPSRSPCASLRKGDFFFIIIIFSPLLAGWLSAGTNLHGLWVFFAADQIILCVCSVFRVQKVSFPEPLSYRVDKRLEDVYKPALFLGCFV